ncbi:MAG: hypothetical protein M3211_04935, partial [Actinomycetota bacterium]|nr:hypothetical protein [Actinomycetota bacterium]
SAGVRSTRMDRPNDHPATASGRRDGKVVFLHIGLHKTGSSYLQSVLRANAHQLAEQGVHLPASRKGSGPNVPAWDLMGRRPRDSRDDRITGRWHALVSEVLEDPRPRSMVSMEYLSLATVRQARQAVHSFGGAEVHVIVTARDLGRVLVSAWQEAVKNDETWTWAQFASATRDPHRRGQNPGRGFWLRQDLPAVLENWRAVLPVDHVHVVTVPPPGTPPELLLRRLGALVGFDADRLGEPARWTNEGIGVAGTEMVRRLNEHLDHDLNQRQYVHVVQQVLVRELVRRTQPARLVLPGEDLAWVREESRRMIGAVAAAGHPVVGDLGELMPEETSGRHPDSASEAELLEASLAALAGIATRYGALWWKRGRPEQSATTAPTAVRAASSARGVLFRGKRAVAELADRHPLAGRAVGAYLGARSAARRRTMRR